MDNRLNGQIYINKIYNKKSKYSLSQEQIYEGINKRVKQKFNLLPACGDWWGGDSLHHEDWGEGWDCTCNINDPSRLEEYLAQEGFDVARDQYTAFYIRKSDSFYIVFDGCLEIAGRCPGKK